ncbi:MAG: metallophosphoesterase family protein [Planctomycetota bacterium]
MPKIGLLSDSHGRAATTRRGVDVLLKQGADVLIHLGDVGTVEVIDALCVDKPSSGDQIESHLVFGNTDWDIDSLAEYADDLDVAVDHPVGRIPLADGGDLVFCHGHESKPMQQAVAEGAKYLCHGHTHSQEDDRQGSTRVINPGALFRASVYSVAILDTATDQLVFFEVESH